MGKSLASWEGEFDVVGLSGSSGDYRGISQNPNLENHFLIVVAGVGDFISAWVKIFCMDAC